MIFGDLDSSEVAILGMAAVSVPQRRYVRLPVL
jgi:hypothetical protein